MCCLALGSLVQIPMRRQAHWKPVPLKHARFWAHVSSPPAPHSSHAFITLRYSTPISSHLAFHAFSIQTFLGCDSFRTYWMLGKENHDKLFQIFLSGYWACFLASHLHIPKLSTLSYSWAFFNFFNCCLGC